MPGVDTIHTAGPLAVSGSSAFNLDTIDNLGVDHGTKEVLEYAAGQVDPSYVATMTSEPMLTFTTRSLAAALSRIALDGMAFPNGGTYTTVDQWFIKVEKTLPRATGANQFRVRMTEGLIVPKVVSWQQGQAASLTAEVHPTYDGTNNPLGYLDSQTLPVSFSGIVGELFTGGKVVINGVELLGVQGVSIDFGLEVEKIYSRGDVFPFRAHILTRKPTITIRTKQVTSLSTFGITGTPQGVTESDIYFQKIKKLETRELAASAVHLRFRVNASQGMITTGSFGGGNNESHEGEVKIFPIVGASPVLSINTAIAIA